MCFACENMVAKKRTTKFKKANRIRKNVSVRYFLVNLISQEKSLDLRSVITIFISIIIHLVLFYMGLVDSMTC